MRRVLIITYYWPPTGGSGVQRWLKFSKYLPENGWQPVIYTPSNPEATTKDDTLLKDIPDTAEIIKQPIIEPYSIYKLFMGKRHSETKGFINPINNNDNKSFKERVSLWIRSNVFIPDPRIFWVNPSVRFLKKYLKQHPVDAIVSTGPPHSMHLIALKLSRATGIRWIADFRDPWTKDFSFKHLNMGKAVYSKHKHLELAVLKQANEIVTVTYNMKKEFEEMVDKVVNVVHNGYDESDFADKPVSLDDHFSITFSGLFNAEGNPENLWKVLNNISIKDDSFRKDLIIQLIGKVDNSILESINKSNLSDNLIQTGYLNHCETTLLQQKSRVLLLPLRNQPEAIGILSGKYFEYLAAQRPIIAFGPLNSELATSLKDTSAGEIFDWNEVSRLQHHIEQLYLSYKNNNSRVLDKNPINTEYSRRSLTSKIVKILDNDE